MSIPGVVHSFPNKGNWDKDMTGRQSTGRLAGNRAIHLQEEGLRETQGKEMSGCGNSIALPLFILKSSTGNFKQLEEVMF